MSPLLKLLGVLLILQFVSSQDEKPCVINGKPYECSKQQYVLNCVSFECNCDGTWITNDKYKRTCRECLLANDPHITTFEGAKYDWHGDCTYVLALEEGQTTSYVYNKFTKCYGGGAACVDTVIFKPRVGPIITVQNSYTILTLASPHSAQVIINGYSQSITTTGRQMQVLKGPEHREHPVLAYWLFDCLHLIAVDTQDFLVKICRGSVRIFSHQKRWSQRDVSGMCGSPDGGSADDDLRLRNGTIVKNPNRFGWAGQVASIFAQDWTVATGACQDTSGRRRRSISEDDEEEKCKATDDEKAEYIRVCQELIEKDPSLSEEKKKDFIDGCAFDQCIITESGADSKTIEDALNEWTYIIEQEVTEQENQEDISDADYEYMDYLNDYYDELDNNNPDQPNNDVSTTPAPELTCPISKVIEAGNRQFAFFSCPKTYSEARDFCQLYGWELATPNDQFEQFNERMPNDGEYWLDVKPVPPPSENKQMMWFWQTSPKHQTTEDQWKVGYYNIATASTGTNCASLYQNDGLLAFDCQRKWFFSCESFHFLNVQRSEVIGEMHGQKRVSPLRNN